MPEAITTDWDDLGSPRSTSAANSTRSGDGASAIPTTRRLSAEDRRSQLFDVALELFAERGYASTTMDDIAEAAGVTKPLVYQHFDSKRALYLELMDVFSRQLVDRIVSATADAAGPRQQVEVGMAAYFETMVGNEASFRLIYGRGAPDDPELGEALGRVEHAIAAAIDPLIDAGLEPEHRLLLAYSVVGMVEGASRHWLDGRAERAGKTGSGETSSGSDGTGSDCNNRTGSGSGSSTGSGSGTDRTGRVATAGTQRATTTEEASLLAIRVADLAWAGLRQVHRV